MGNPIRTALVALAVVALATGCDAMSAPTLGPSESAAAPAGSSDPATVRPTVDRTPVPGFEDWETINPQGVRISVDEQGLALELVGSLLWFNTDRGVLFGKDVEGDFRATATVRTEKTLNPAEPPGVDGSIQLAGLMAHASGPIENYVFIVAGSIGASTGVETKTTTRGNSVWVQRGPVEGGDAELQLCRQGQMFTLSWRPADSTADWTRMSTFDRPDLPEELLVGASIYTDGVPDITARYEDLTIEPLADGVAC
jgi:hypothetical protein